MPFRIDARSGEPKLTVRQALVLGALHGPAELLPISSSGHVTATASLLGWRYRELDEELRKSFEVALHTGTAIALLITLRGEVSEVIGDLDRRRLALIALSFAPPAVVGYALERQIERRLGTPRAVAIGLIAGSLAMAVADRFPQQRSHDEAGAVDALWLGLAQASALVPGVSRGGATLVAARVRRFRRPDANRLSRHAALPVITGATVLKGLRLKRRGLEPGAGPAFAAGASASFASTLVSTRLIRQVERDRSLLPYAAYRVALAALLLKRPAR
jgi:undecaprenyl-diphosphatase